MAQPQGLNVPAIATTGIVTVLLTVLIIEGVRAYYNYTLQAEEAAKWSTVTRTTPMILRDEQLKNISDTPLPIAAAMAKVVQDNHGAVNTSTRSPVGSAQGIEGNASGGKMTAPRSTTKPND